MRTIALFLILFGCGSSHITAQSDYLVTTISNQEDPLSEGEQFIKENFPLQLLCKWTPGMKFMSIPSGRDMFLPTPLVCETEKGADSDVPKHKILTFAGYEEKSQELSNDMSYSTRLIFECDGEKYYYEIKNIRPDEVCEKNPRAYINGLANLKDVDTTKELLTGRKTHVQPDIARVGNANSYSGYRKVSVSVNTEATIAAIGVGSQSYLVKVTFQDSQGHSYYLEVALSRTNSDMDVSDF